MYSLCTECSFFSKLHNLTTNKWEKKCPKIFFNFHCKSFFSVHLVQYPLCNNSDKYFNICIQYSKRECRNYRRKLTMTHSPYKITHSRKLIAKLEYYCTVQTYFYIPLGNIFLSYYTITHPISIMNLYILLPVIIVTWL